jgi:predicted acyl esterase
MNKQLISSVSLMAAALFGVSSLAATPASACHDPPQQTVVVRQRSIADGYEHRIRRGLATGALTHRQAARLQRRVDELRELERLALRDGYLSAHEQRELWEEEDRLAHKLEQALQDREVRFWRRA